MALAAEGMGFHLGHRFGEVVDLLQGIADFLRVGADLVERPQHKAHAVIGLCGGDRVEVAALILEEAFDLFVQRLGVCTLVGRVGSHRHHALDQLLAAELEKVRRYQRPGSGPRDLEPDLLHALGDLHGSRRKRIGDDEIDLGLLHLGELRRHVRVVLIEHFGAGHEVEIGLLEEAQRRVAAALPPAGRVVHQADPLIFPGIDVVDHDRRLDAVVERDAENVALRRVLVALDDLLRGGDGVHQRNLVLLRNVDDGERDAGIDRSDDGKDLVAGDEPGDVFDALCRLGLVVIDDGLDLLALVAALLVVFRERKLGPHPRTLAVVVGAARQREGEADLEVSRRRAAEESGTQQQTDSDDTEPPCDDPSSAAHRRPPFRLLCLLDLSHFCGKGRASGL